VKAVARLEVARTTGDRIALAVGGSSGSGRRRLPAVPLKLASEVQMTPLSVLPRALFAMAALLAGVTTLAAPAVAAAAPKAPAAAATACPKTGARVLVTALGNVTVNGVVVPVDNLAMALNALTPRPTEVCYFREKPKGEPPAAVRIAVNAIISTQLPISFYADASFSTRVGMPSR
jgi:hypothetical protein